MSLGTAIFGRKIFVDGQAQTQKKWGAAAQTAGFTIIPNHLLAINQFVPDERQLSSTEMVVLLQILSSWWFPEKLPFPSKATLAKRTGLSPRQVQRALSSLESKYYIERIARFKEGRSRASNAYNIEGTVKAVQEAAEAHPKFFKSGA